MNAVPDQAFLHEEDAATPRLTQASLTELNLARVWPNATLLEEDHDNAVSLANQQDDPATLAEQALQRGTTTELGGEEDDNMDEIDRFQADRDSNESQGWQSTDEKRRLLMKVVRKEQERDNEQIRIWNEQIQELNDKIRDLLRKHEKQDKQMVILLGDVAEEEY